MFPITAKNHHLSSGPGGPACPCAPHEQLPICTQGKSYFVGHLQVDRPSLCPSIHIPLSDLTPSSHSFILWSPSSTFLYHLINHLIEEKRKFLSHIHIWSHTSLLPYAISFKRQYFPPSPSCSPLAFYRALSTHSSPYLLYIYLLHHHRHHLGIFASRPFFTFHDISRRLKPPPCLLRN